MRALFSALSLLLILMSAGVTAAEYAIVVSEKAKTDAQWSQVVEALSAKYENTKIIVWGKNVQQSLADLSKLHPKYTCFVATGEEADRQFVADVHRLTRKFDDDPYCDTQWGILTGYDAANALKIANDRTPLVIKKVASGTEFAINMCQQGIWYDELVKEKMVSKQSDGSAKEAKGPADTTAALADTLSDYQADLFITSGHATERNWQIGFRYRNGYFISQAGKMYGAPVSGDRFEIKSSNPKVYLAVGNCLMGHINGPDAMALAWLNSVGVNQMVGYTVNTWYGYSGWGVLDYFVEQPGRFTLAEAFHANQHALIHRLETCFEAGSGTQFQVGSRSIPTSPVTETGKKLGLSVMDSRGLNWDRDVVALYGDPAWQAKMETFPPAYDQQLEIKGNTYRFVITPNRGKESFDPINTNGAQRGWRPMVHFLDQRIKNIEIKEGSELNPVIADDFILIPNPKECDPEREYKIVFTAQPIDAN